MQVFSLMNLIIERLNEAIQPFADQILQLLPDLWQLSEKQSLLRIQVPATVQSTTLRLGALLCGRVLAVLYVR